MSHTSAVITVYKKVPPGTIVEDTDGISLPVDGFGQVEVDLDQPGTTTKPVKMVSVAYVPGLRGIYCSPVKQWSDGVNRLCTTKQRLLRGSRGRSCSILTSSLARVCFPQYV